MWRLQQTLLISLIIVLGHVRSSDETDKEPTQSHISGQPHNHRVKRQIRFPSPSSSSFASSPLSSQCQGRFCNNPFIKLKKSSSSQTSPIAFSCHGTFCNNPFLNQRKFKIGREVQTSRAKENRPKDRTTFPHNSRGTPQQDTQLQRGNSLLPRNCGYSSAKFRILNGKSVMPGEFPWIALLGYLDHSSVDYDFKCAGSLINDRYVITAAHCLRHPANSARLAIVRLGEYNIKTRNDCIQSRVGTSCLPSPQERHPIETVTHPSYETNTVNNDIGLVRLDKPVKLTSFVHPVCLPPAGLDVGALVGRYSATVSGWGETESSASASVLQKLRVRFVKNAKCSRRLGISVSDKQVCFGGAPEKDSCRGDSGGPLVFPKTVNGPPYLLIGVVSFGRTSCGVRGVPGVYTNIAAYIPWIVNSLKP